MPCCNLLRGVYNKKHEMNKYSAASADRILKEGSSYEKEKGRYIELISKLDALSPLKTLYRGYSITEKDGSVVKSVKQLKSGDNIEIRFNDGSKKAVVK